MAKKKKKKKMLCVPLLSPISSTYHPTSTQCAMGVSARGSPRQAYAQSMALWAT